MKRILYTSLLLFAVSIQVEAKKPMREWLKTMPDSVMPLLTKNNRLDFFDYYDAKMEAVVTNRLDGKSRMTKLTDDYIQISYTPSTNITMRLLPVSDSTNVLCMVTTIVGTASDSRIAFFDAQWQPLETTLHLTEPCIDDFRSISQNNPTDEIWDKMDIFFRTYCMEAENTELKCTITTPNYLSKEDKEAITPYLRNKPLIYYWTNGKYQRNE